MHCTVIMTCKYAYLTHKRLIGSLIFIGHFPQKWLIFSGSFVENDLQLRRSYESSPPCTHPLYSYTHLLNSCTHVLFSYNDFLMRASQLITHSHWSCTLPLYSNCIIHMSSIVIHMHCTVIMTCEYGYAYTVAKTHRIPYLYRSFSAKRVL